jgi:hypothetical protein
MILADLRLPRDMRTTGHFPRPFPSKQTVDQLLGPEPEAQNIAFTQRVMARTGRTHHLPCSRRSGRAIGRLSKIPLLLALSTLPGEDWPEHALADESLGHRT